MSQQPNEQRFLLRCLHNLLTGKPSGDVPQLDWVELYKLASAHKLTPLLAPLLSLDVVPPQTAAALQHDIRRQKMRTALMFEEFARLHDALTAAGIKVMPIKGIALAQTVYPGHSLRYFDDIDLLVPPPSAPRAMEVLANSGYIVHPNAPSPDWHHLPPHIHREHYTMVEIHTDLVRRARSGWSIDEIWSRASQQAVNGNTTWLMAPEDALIYTALHARHNLYNRLTFMIDASLLATQINQDQKALARLAELMGEAGARNAVAYVLATARRLFDLKLLPSLSPSPISRRVASWISDWPDLSRPRRNAKGPLPKLLELLLMDSVGDSLRLAVRLLAPPADFVQAGYGEPGEHAAGYGRRILTRARLTAGQIVALLKPK